jgi:phthiocerol/phenolphthiocerol synthesis type-I polyketide synthase E
MGRENAIAIIGMACRFPGAKNVDEYWQNLLSGTESVRHFSDEELLEAGISRTSVEDPRYVKAMPSIDHLEEFDAKFFGMTPREAEVRDPQHRLFLEAAYAAMEDAGRDPFAGYKYGVYSGSAPNAYQETNVASNPDRARAVGQMTVSLSNSADYISPTVSYKLGLRGPSVNVLTACSSSLVAIHLAIKALRDGEIDGAVAGGVEVELPTISGYYWNDGGIYSRAGHVRPFDAGADGTIFGTGCGVVVLRRLSDAIADGDRILSVIRGSAVNNDAADRVGFTAPSVSGQSSLIRAALDDAGVDATAIGYVEAHGTGTLVGDPIEITALTDAFRSRGALESGTKIVSSVKGNIGHLGPAAGVAGLIKATMAVRTGQVPPSVNFDEANPKIDFADTPFQVHTTVADWPQEGPRMAGISSFGIGGTNAHVVIEEPPAQPLSSGGRPWQVLPLSAKTPTALAARAESLAAHLAAADTPTLTEPELADLASTLAIGRPQLTHRRAAVARVDADLPALLAGGGSRKHGRLTDAAEARGAAPSLAFLFSGQGSQHLSAAAGIYGIEPVFTKTVDELALIAETETGVDIRDIIAGNEALSDRVGMTEIAQPTLFIIEYALAKQWIHWGLTPDALIGHSVGEIVAAALAGVFDPSDALRLVCARGRLMQSMPTGSMLAVPLSADQIDLGEELSLAALNAPELTVVSGPTAAIDALKDTLTADGIVAQALRTSHGFHSKEMQGAVTPFTKLVASVERSAPQIPIVSNVTGDYLSDADACDPAYWGEHLRRPVHFDASLARLIEDGCGAFLEVGPSQALTSLAKRKVRGIEGAVAVPSLRHPGRSGEDGEVIATAIATLWTHGVEIDWPAVHDGAPRLRMGLPTYPFERKRHWLDPKPMTSNAPQNTMHGLIAGVTDGAAKPAPVAEAVASQATASEDTPARPDHGIRLFEPEWVERVATPGEPVATGSRWLLLGGDDLLTDELVNRLRDRGDTVMTVQAGAGYREMGPGRYTIGAGVSEDIETLFATLDTTNAIPDRIVHAWLTAPVGASAAQDGPEAQELGFHTLLGISRALMRHAHGRETHVDIVTRGVFGATGEEPMAPERASVQGIAHLLPQELAPATCRHVDLGPANPQTAESEIDKLTAELLSAASEPKLALRGRKTWAWSHREHQVEAATAAPALLRERGTYLITGGMGGIGLAVAEDLAKLVRAKLVLVGRSAFPDAADWDTVLADADTPQATKDKIAILRRIEELGGSVLIASGDSGDEDAMREIVAQAKQRFGRIHGVFHSAGVAAGGMMAIKRREAAEQTFRPKLDGLRVIDTVFGTELDFLVLFSSIASVATDFGLSDYAAANSVLDAYAHAHAGEDRYVVSVNWGGWAEVGMAVDTEQNAPDAFRAMQSGLSFEEIAHPLLTHRRVKEKDDGLREFATFVEPDSHWVLGEHKLGATQVWPGTAYLELVRAAYAEYAPAQDAIELCDVMFMAPLAISGPTELRVVFHGDGAETAFTVVAAAKPHNGNRWVEHCRGRVRRAPMAPRTLDQNALWGELAVAGPPPATSSPSGMVTLGAHWDSVAEVRGDDVTTMARLVLPEALGAETGEFVLHPSLLDCATAIVLDLPAATGPGKGFLPFSYGRVLVREAVPAQLHTVIRHKSKPEAQLQCFDIALVADDGTVVVDITDFAVRILDTSETHASLGGGEPGAAKAAPTPAQGSGTIREILGLPANIGTGITNAAGLTALRHILAVRPGPQVVAINDDLGAKLARVATLTGEQFATGTQKKAAAPASPGTPALTAAPAAATTGSGEAPTPEGFGQATIADTLLEFMRDALGDEELGVDDDFFESGGNSLVAVQVGARVRGFFEIDLPVVKLFDAPTIRQLAEVVEAELAGRGDYNSGAAAELSSRA